MTCCWRLTESLPFCYDFCNDQHGGDAMAATCCRGGRLGFSHRRSCRRVMLMNVKMRFRASPLISPAGLTADTLGVHAILNKHRLVASDFRAEP